MTPAPATAAQRECAAFISYRHADNKEPDCQRATWLHYSLETYAVPVDLVGKINDRGDTIPHHRLQHFLDRRLALAQGTLPPSAVRSLRCRFVMRA